MSHLELGSFGSKFIVSRVRSILAVRQDDAHPGAECRAAVRSTEICHRDSQCHNRSHGCLIIRAATPFFRVDRTFHAGSVRNFKSEYAGVRGM